MIATTATSGSPRRTRSISVPAVHPALAFVLSAMAGHLFGYEAALAIDASARPLREAVRRIESAGRSRRSADDGLLRWLSPRLEPGARPVLRRAAHRRLRRAPRSQRPPCASRRCCATRLRRLPLDAYQIEHGKVGTPSAVVEDLRPRSRERSRSSPGRSTRSSTRPRRSRSASRGPTRRCSPCRSSQAVLAAGAPRDRLSYRTLAHARRARPGGRGGHRLHPLPHRRRPARRAGDDLRRRPRRHRARLSVAHRAQPDAAGHEAPCRDRARGHWRRVADPTAAPWCSCPR